MHRLDLGRWAGRTVELSLSTSASENGILAFWGAPTVRQASPATERPQIVILFLADTLRADHLDAWGYGRPTAPTVTKLATEGLRFQNVISQSTWTKASVPSILTGMYPSTTGIVSFADRLSEGETTMSEVFRQAGYATFSTSSIPFTGRLTNLHQGVESMAESTALEKPVENEFRAKTAEAWTDLFLEFLDQHHDVPVFAVLHVMDPHSPFRPEAPWDTHWAGADAAERFEEMSRQLRPHIRHPGAKFFLAPLREELEAAGVDAEAFVEIEKAWYDGSIRAMDQQLARVLERLEHHGLAERSLVAFVSDHGEEFLEHGRHFHGFTVYGEVNRVPMVLWGHGVPAGRTLDDLVQTIDLAPTLYDLVGLPVPERTQGRSLLPLLHGAGPSLPAYSERRAQDSPMEMVPVSSFAVIEGPWKLILEEPLNGDLPADRDLPADEKEYQLFRQESDPLDQNDLAAEHPQVVEELAKQLESWRSWAENQRLDDRQRAEAMSAEELEHLRRLGYID